SPLPQALLDSTSSAPGRVRLAGPHVNAAYRSEVSPSALHLRAGPGDGGSRNTHVQVRVATSPEAGQDPGRDGQLKPDRAKFAQSELQARAEQEGQLVLPGA